MGIVGTHADMPDNTLFLQFLRVFQDRTFKNGLEILFTVNIMDHANIDIVGVQAFQKICKGTLCLFYITGTSVLTIFIDGAKMSLNDKLIPASLQGNAEVITGRSLRHEDVDVVDSMLLCRIHDCRAFFGGQAVEPLAAQTDFANFQTGSPQNSIIHILFSIMH